MEWDGTGWNGTERDGMGRNAMEWDGKGWDRMLEGTKRLSALPRLSTAVLCMYYR